MEYNQVAPVENVSEITVDLNTVMVFLFNGQPVLNTELLDAAGEKTVPLTAQFAITRCLLESYSDEQTTSFEKAYRGQLATRVFKSNGIVKLSSLDVTTIKTLIGKFYNTMIVSQIFDLLDQVNQ